MATFTNWLSSNNSSSEGQTIAQNQHRPVEAVMAHGEKRKAEDYPQARVQKHAKTKKQWRVPRKNDGNSATQPRVIQPGDSGIWITCNKGKEGRCVSEMKDVFAEYAQQLYGDSMRTMTTAAKTDEVDDSAQQSADIEHDIQAEIDDLHQHMSIQPFTPIRIDLQCVCFFKTLEPVEPVTFVKKICEDAMHGSQRKRTRFAKRLSPMTLMGRASEEGLDKTAREVLAPYFHQEPVQTRKFAIRPTLRNHSILTRDSIIKQVASIVGPGHEVNLRNYDLLVIVEVYQNVCGVSVLDRNFESLKRFNLAEIYDPTPVERRTEDGAEQIEVQTQQMSEGTAGAMETEVEATANAEPEA